MLTVEEASNVLNVSKKQVYRYIKKGLLQSIKDNGVCKIKTSDFQIFRKNLFSKINKSKGNKTPRLEEFLTLKTFVDDILNHSLPYHAFKTKYKSIEILVSPLKNFEIYKRNEQIVFDFTNKTSQKDLAKKYNLSLRSIEEITRNWNKNENNFNM